jgi:hypothetical protein
VKTDLTDDQLNSVRVLVRAQIARTAEVHRRAELFESDEPASWRGLQLRCEKPHAGGKKPKVAEVHATRFGIFYVARLPWARSDANRLLPWVEETHLERTFRNDPSQLEDDDALRTQLEQIEWWRENGQGDLAWLAERSAREHRLVEILNLPDTAGMLTLWSRCPAHLDDYEEIDPARLLEALR